MTPLKPKTTRRRITVGRDPPDGEVLSSSSWPFGNAFTDRLVILIDDPSQP
jgi:hypothetical protein